jgi:hypothetical protein
MAGITGEKSLSDGIRQREKSAEAGLNPPQFVCLRLYCYILVIGYEHGRG